MVLREAGSGVFQLICNSNLSAEEQFELLRQIAARSGRPVSFTLAQSPSDPGQWRYAMAELDRANAEGLEIRGQVIARGLPPSSWGWTCPFILSPSTPRSSR